MMNWKPSLRNSVNPALINLLLIIFLFLGGCSFSTSPAFLKEDTAQAVKDISKKEYNLDVTTRLIGSSLWVYMPLENIITKPEKPEKFIERFSLEEKKNSLNEKTLYVNYLVKPVKEKEQEQEMAIDKSVNEKIFYLLQIIRRVLFSTDASKETKPLFFCIVTADIKNGFELKQIFHLMDLKKLSYGFISQAEYQHRIVQSTNVSALIIADKEGSHLNYHDITLEEFLADQIQGRIRLKFGKPEVEKNADIDKEVLKIIAYTLKTYEFKDFKFVEMFNQATGEKMLFNEKAILSSTKD